MDKNQDIEQLINNINHISLEFNELLNEFIKNNNAVKLTCDSSCLALLVKLENKKDFIDCAVICTREAIILGMMSISLKKNVDFHRVFAECRNLSLEYDYIKNLNLINEEEKIIKNYFNRLKIISFENVFKDNHDLLNKLNISSEDVDKRITLYKKVLKIK